MVQVYSAKVGPVEILMEMHHINHHSALNVCLQSTATAFMSRSQSYFSICIAPMELQVQKEFRQIFVQLREYKIKLPGRLLHQSNHGWKCKTIHYAAYYWCDNFWTNGFQREVFETRHGLRYERDFWIYFHCTIIPLHWLFVSCFHTASAAEVIAQFLVFSGRKDLLCASSAFQTISNQEGRRVGLLTTIFRL